MEEVSYVTTRWKASESCSLVGVGSVGKSNLIQHLSDSDTQYHYLGDAATAFKAIIIDPNMLGPVDENDSIQFRCWAGYELMMHRLYMAFHPFDVLGEQTDDFFDTYQELRDGSSPLHLYMGLRYFELGLEFFLRKKIQIVFMFDEFEEMLRLMPPKFFQTLRGLRDNHKTRLSYLTFSREPLPVLNDKMRLPEAEMEPFTELFTDNTYYVGPYNRNDARAMVERLMRRNRKTYPSHVTTFLLDISGGFAGILRASFRVLSHIQSITPADTQNNEFIRKIARKQPVRAECETIWNSLTPVEQEVLKAVARLLPENVTDDTELAISLLVQKRLLVIDDNNRSLQIRPPLFRHFVQTDPPTTH
jgi:hypothetical protein